MIKATQKTDKQNTQTEIIKTRGTAITTTTTKRGETEDGRQKVKQIYTNPKKMEQVTQRDQRTLQR